MTSSTRWFRGRKQGLVAAMRRRRSAGATALYGAAYGFLPIGWIILNAVFLYNLTVETGQFEIVKSSVGRLSSSPVTQKVRVMSEQ